MGGAGIGRGVHLCRFSSEFMPARGRKAREPAPWRVTQSIAFEGSFHDTIGITVRNLPIFTSTAGLSMRFSYLCFEAKKGSAMKNLLIVIAALFLFGMATTDGYATTATTCTIKNFRVNGQQYLFDITARSTGTHELYVDSAAFIFNFDSHALDASAPALSNMGRFNTANGYQMLAGYAGGHLYVTLKYVGGASNFVSLSSTEEAVCTVTLAAADVAIPRNLVWVWMGASGILKDGFNPYIIINNLVGADTSSTPLPVALTSFNVNALNGAATLRWSTSTEINNYGFYVEKSADQQTWASVAFLNGHGTSLVPQTYSFTDPEPSTYYRLKQVDLNGDAHYSDVVLLGVTGVETETPDEFALMQNYPNPFNPSTTIKFEIARPSDVKLAVYTSDGREVAVLVNERREAGSYQVKVDGSNLSSGVYFYRINAGDFVQTRKLVLLK
jgi:hypothetical protein